MRSGSSIFTLFLIAAGVALAAILSAPAQQPPRRSRAIQFSEPRSEVVSSNVNELGANKKRLKNLEDDLKKPFEVFNPADDSIPRLVSPPLRRQLPSASKARQMKELLEKRKEWIFLEAEDYYAPGLTAEEMLGVTEYGPDGEEKKKKTPLENYYDRLDKARAQAQVAATNQSRGDDGLNPLRLDKAKDGREPLNELSFGDPSKNLSPTLNDIDPVSKPWTPADSPIYNSSASENAKTKSFSEVFGFGTTEPINATLPTSGRSSAMEARMQEFKQLLQVSSPTPLNSGAGTLSQPVNPTTPNQKAPTATGLDLFAGAGARSSSTSLAADPSLPTSLPGLPMRPTSPTLMDRQMPPPTTESPRMTLPPAFKIPQRKF